MRGLSSLRARLAKVEARRKALPVTLLILDVVDPEAATGDVIGAGAGDLYVARRAGEPLDALLARAHAETGAMYLAARYDAVAPVSGPPAPQPAPALPEPPEHDPWALAGIGRRATRAELEASGAIAVPPERLR